MNNNKKEIYYQKEYSDTKDWVFKLIILITFATYIHIFKNNLIAFIIGIILIMIILIMVVINSRSDKVFELNSDGIIINNKKFSYNQVINIETIRIDEGKKNNQIDIIKVIFNDNVITYNEFDIKSLESKYYYRDESGIKRKLTLNNSEILVMQQVEKVKEIIEKKMSEANDHQKK